MGTGLTFDEYVDVKLRPPTGEERLIQRGFEAQVAEMFPLNTVGCYGPSRSDGRGRSQRRRSSTSLAEIHT